MPHDFKKFPELTNSQIQFYYLDSPHKQITEDLRVEVVKVIGGDTIRVMWHERDFDFPVRMLNTNAPEMNEGGEEAKEWLKDLIEGEEVDLLINKKQRVGKWGRLLAIIMFKGINLNDESITSGYSTTFEDRHQGKIMPIEQMMGEWL